MDTNIISEICSYLASTDAECLAAELSSTKLENVDKPFTVSVGAYHEEQADVNVTTNCKEELFLIFEGYAFIVAQLDFLHYLDFLLYNGEEFSEEEKVIFVQTLLATLNQSNTEAVLPSRDIISDFVGVFMEKLEQKEKLLYTDYSQYFPSMPINFDIAEVYKKQEKFQSLVGKFGSKNEFEFNEFSNDIVFTEKSVECLEMVSYIMIYLEANILDLIEGCSELQLNNFHTIEEIFLECICNVEKLKACSSFLELKEMSIIFNVIEMYLNENELNSESLLPELVFFDPELTKVAGQVIIFKSILEDLCERKCEAAEKQMNFFESLYNKCGMNIISEKLIEELLQRNMNFDEIELNEEQQYKTKMKIKEYFIQDIQNIFEQILLSKEELLFDNNEVLVLVKIFIFDIGRSINNLLILLYSIICRDAKSFDLEYLLAEFSVEKDILSDTIKSISMYKQIINCYYEAISISEVLIGCIFSRLYDYQTYYENVQNDDVNNFDKFIGFSFSEAKINKLQSLNYVCFDTILSLVCYSNELMSCVEKYYNKVEKSFDGSLIRNDKCQREIEELIQNLRDTFSFNQKLISCVNVVGAIIFALQNTIDYEFDNDPEDEVKTRLNEFLQINFEEKQMIYSEDLTFWIIETIYSEFNEEYKYLYYETLEFEDSLQIENELRELRMRNIFANTSNPAQSIFEITKFSQALARQLCDILETKEDYKNSYEIILFEKKLYNNQNIVSCIKNNEIKDSLLEHYNKCIIELLSDLRNYNQYVTSIMSEKNILESIFGNTLTNNIFSNRNLSEIILFLQEIISKSTENNISIKNIQLISKYYPQNSELQSLILESKDLQYNCIELQHIIYEKWLEKKITGELKKLLNRALLKYQNSLHRSGSDMHFQNLSYLQEMFVIDKGGKKVDNIIHFLSEGHYSINIPEWLINTSFELSKIASIIDIDTTENEYLIISAEEAEQLCSILKQILLARNKIIVELSYLELIEYPYEFEFIDCEYKLHQLAIEITWSSIRAIDASNELLKEYNLLYNSINFTQFKYVSLLEEYKNDVSEYETYIINIGKQKYTIEELQQLITELVVHYINIVKESSSNLLSFSDYLRTQLSRVTEFSYYFHECCESNSCSSDDIYCGAEEYIHKEYYEEISAEIIKSYTIYIKEQYCYDFCEMIYSLASHLYTDNIIFELEEENSRFYVIPTIAHINKQIILYIKDEFEHFCREFKIDNYKIDKFLFLIINRISENLKAEQDEFLGIVEEKFKEEDGFVEQPSKYFLQANNQCYEELIQIGDYLLKLLDNKQNQCEELDNITAFLNSIELFDCSIVKYSNFREMNVVIDECCQNLRIELSKYLFEFEKIMNNNSYSDNEIKSSITNIEFLINLFTSLDVFESLEQNTEQIKYFVNNLMSNLNNRQDEFFNMEYEYYVVRLFKNDENYNTTLGELCGQLSDKLNELRIILQVNNISISEFIEFKCLQLNADSEFFLNKLSDQSGFELVIEELDLNRNFIINDVFNYAEIEDIQQSDFLDELAEQLSIEYINIDKFTKQVLGFDKDDIFAINRSNELIKLQFRQAMAQNCIYIKLDGSIEKINIQLTLPYNIVLTQICEYFRAKAEEQVLEEYLDFYSVKNVKNIIEKLDFAAQRNKSQLLIASYLELLEQEVCNLLENQSFYIEYDWKVNDRISQSLETLNETKELLEMLEEYFNDIYEFEQIKLTSIELDSEESDNSVMLSKTRAILQKGKEFEDHVLNDESVNIENGVSLCYFHLLQEAFEEAIYPELVLIWEHHILFEKIASDNEELNSLGNVFDSLFSTEKFNATESKIQEQKEEFERKQLLHAMSQEAKELHENLFNTTIDLLEENLNNELFEILEQSIIIQENIMAEILSFENSNNNSDEIVASFNELFEQCKSIQIIVENLLEQRNAFEIVKEYSGITKMINLLSVLENYEVGEKHYLVSNNISCEYVEPVTEYLEMALPEYLQLQNITLIGDNEQYKGELNIPLYEQLNCSGELKYSINPISHLPYEHLEYKIKDCFGLTDNDEISVELKPEFCGFVSTGNQGFNLTDEVPILFYREIYKHGSYEELLFSYEELVDEIVVQEEKWRNFSTRYLNSNSNILESSKLFPEIVEELQIMKYFGEQIEVKYEELFQHYESYYPFVNNVSSSECLELLTYQYKCEEFDNQYYKVCIKNYELLKPLNEFSNHIEKLSLCELLGIKMSCFYCVEDYIIGLELVSGCQVIFSNKILCKHDKELIPILFLANYIRIEYANSMKVGEIYLFKQKGMVRYNNFVFEVSSVLQDDITKINYKNPHSLEQLLYKMNDKREFLITYIRKSVFWFDLPDFITNEQNEEDDIAQIYKLPNSTFYQYIICFITLRLSAEILQNNNKKETEYLESINQLINELEELGEQQNNVERQYFVKIIRFSFFRLQNEQTHSKINNIVKEFNNKFDKLESLESLFVKIQSEVDKVLKTEQNDEFFVDVEMIQELFENCGYDVLSDYLNIEQYIKKTFFIHQLAYELTSKLFADFCIFGYMECLPSISYTAEYNSYLQDDVIGYKLSKEKTVFERSNNLANNIIDEQILFDSPFYSYREYLLKDSEDIYYQASSFRILLNYEGHLTICNSYSQDLFYNNFSSYDFYESFYILKENLVKHEIITLVSINEIALILYANIIGKYIVFNSMKNINRDDEVENSNYIIVVYDDEEEDRISYKSDLSNGNSQYIFITNNLPQGLQYSNILTYELKNIESYELRMDYQEYSSKLLQAKITMSHSSNSTAFRNCIATTVSRFPQSKISSILSNFLFFITIYQELSEEFDITKDFENAIEFIHLLASAEYSLLLEFLSTLKNTPLAECFKPFEQVYTDLASKLEIEEAEDLIIIPLLLDHYLKRIIIMEECTAILNQIIIILELAFNFDYYYLIAYEDNYEIYFANRIIIISFQKVGYSPNILRQEYEEIEKYIYSKCGELELEENLYQFLSEEYPLLNSETVSEYIVYTTNLTIKQSLILRNISSKINIENFNENNSFLLFDADKLIAEEYGWHNAYFITPELLSSIMFLRSILYGFSEESRFEHEIIEIVNRDSSIKLEQLLFLANLLNNEYVLHKFSTLFSSVIKIVDNMDINSEEFYESLTLDNFYGYIFICYEASSEQLGALEKRLLQRLNNYIIVAVAERENADLPVLCTINICELAEEDEMKLMQHEFMRMLNKFAGISIIFEDASDVQLYTAMFLRKMYALFNNINVLRIWLCVLINEIAKVTSFDKDSLSSHCKLSLIALFELEELYNFSITVDELEEFMILVFEYVINLPRNIPLQSYDIHNSEVDLNDPLFDYQEEQFEMKYYNIEFEHLTECVLFTESHSGNAQIDTFAERKCYLLTEYIKLFEEPFVNKPLYINRMNILLFYYSVESIDKTIYFVFNNENSELQEIKNNICRAIKQGASDVIKEECKIVVVFDEEADKDIENFIEILTFNNPFSFFDYELKFRLRAILEINDNMIMQLIRYLLIPVIEQNRSTSTILPVRNHELLSVTFLAETHSFDKLKQQLQEENDEVYKSLNGKRDELDYLKIRYFNAVQSSFEENFRLFSNINKNINDQNDDSLKMQLREYEALNIIYKRRESVLQHTIQQLTLKRDEICEEIITELKEIQRLENEYTMLENEYSDCQIQFFTYQEELESASEKFERMKRYILANIKSFNNPQGLIKRIIDCLAIFLNINILCVEYYFGEIQIEYEDSIYGNCKPIFVQSTYNSTNEQLIIAEIQNLENDTFRLERYCFERGYEIIYCQLEKGMAAEALFDNVTLTDIIHKEQILSSKITESDTGNILKIEFTCPSDSFRLLESIVNNSSFISRIIDINPTELTDEEIELLQPYLQSPDFNSITAIMTSYDAYELISWIYAIIDIKNIYANYHPIDERLKEYKKEMENIKIQIDHLEVKGNEEQLIADKLAEEIESLCTRLEKCENEELQAKTNQQIYRNSIDDLMQEQKGKYEYLQKFVDNYSSITNSIESDSAEEFNPIKMNFQLFDKYEIYEAKESEFYIYSNNTNIVSAQDFLYCSIDPWICSLLSEAESISISKALILSEILIVVDSDNRFELIIKNLISMLASINEELNNLAQLQKVCPYYECEFYNIYIFQSITSFFSHARSISNGLFIIFTTEEEINSREFQIYELNKNEEEHIILIIKNLYFCELQAEVINFDLPIPERLYLASELQNQNNIVTQLEHLCCRQYLSYVEFIHCLKSQNNDIITCCKDKFVSDRNNYCQFFNNYKSLLQSYEDFYKYCQQLLNLQTFKNTLTIQDIIVLIRDTRLQIAASEFVDDSKFHESIEQSVISTLEKHISIEEYVEKYFNILDSQAASNLYIKLFYEYDLFSDYTLQTFAFPASVEIQEILSKFVAFVSKYLGCELQIEQNSIYYELAVLQLCANDRDYANQLDNMIKNMYAKSSLSDLLIPLDFLEAIEKEIDEDDKVSEEFVLKLGILFLLFAFQEYNSYEEVLGTLPEIQSLKEIEYNPENFCQEQYIGYKYIGSCDDRDTQYQLLLDKDDTGIVYLQTIQLKELIKRKYANIVVSGYPSKLYESILLIAPSVIERFYELPNLFVNLNKIKIEEFTKYSLPNLILAQVLANYASSYSPFEINYELLSLYVKIITMINRYESNFEDFDDMFENVSIIDNCVLFENLRIKVASAEENLTEELLIAVEPIVRQISKPVSISEIHTTTNEIDWQEEWVEENNKIDEKISSLSTLTARHCK